MAAEWYSGHTDVVNDLFVESFPEKVLSWLRPVIDRAYGTNGAVFLVAKDAQGGVPPSVLFVLADMGGPRGGVPG